MKTTDNASPFRSTKSPVTEQKHWSATYYCFYQVERWGIETLSDHGGPFGFDIHAALLVDYLIRAHRCDAILETGSHLGDTTVYLSKRYPHLPVVSCDINSTYAETAAGRLRDLPNATVEAADSRSMLGRWIGKFQRPFVFLDAHWLDDWPLKQELEMLRSGVICIDDFNVGKPGFAFDHYHGIECGPALLLPFGNRVPHYYVPQPTAHYPYPCLQPVRRGGKAFIELELSISAMEGHAWFERRENAQA
jgi:hypothetical protein